MKPKAKLVIRSIKDAQKNLESAVRKFVNSAEWVNPYSISGRRYVARITELRVPLAELRIARKHEQAVDKNPNV